MLPAKGSQPLAHLINYAERARLKINPDILSDAVLMEQIFQGEKFYSNGRKGLSFEKFRASPSVLETRSLVSSS